MANAFPATPGYPAGDDRRQRSSSRPRKRRKCGNVEHIHFNYLLIAGSIGWAFAGQNAGALFEYRSAWVAEIGHVLSNAVFNSREVGNVADAEAERVGSARCPLL